MSVALLDTSLTYKQVVDLLNDPTLIDQLQVGMEGSDDVRDDIVASANTLPDDEDAFPYLQSLQVLDEQVGAVNHLVAVLKRNVNGDGTFEFDDEYDLATAVHLIYRIRSLNAEGHDILEHIYGDPIDRLQELLNELARAN